MSKNIETCKSEEVLSSVLDQQPQDYPSVQQAVHDLGVTALPAASAADPDIAELPSNVEVFVRRVLKAVVYDRVLPVVQQMWQAVLNRCSDYIPASLYPYASNPSLRTLCTLPTALSALSVRKISNGGATNDGIPDGVSLAHLLCGDYAAVKELIDDNVWDEMNIAVPNSLFPNLEKIVLGHLPTFIVINQLGCRSCANYMSKANSINQSVVGGTAVGDFADGEGRESRRKSAKGAQRRVLSIGAQGVGQVVGATVQHRLPHLLHHGQHTVIDHRFQHATNKHFDVRRQLDDVRIGGTGSRQRRHTKVVHRLLHRTVVLRLLVKHRRQHLFALACFDIFTHNSSIFRGIGSGQTP